MIYDHDFNQRMWIVLSSIVRLAFNHQLERLRKNLIRFVAPQTKHDFLQTGFAAQIFDRRRQHDLRATLKRITKNAR